jgi:ubiquinone biosynthesis protein
MPALVLAPPVAWSDLQRASRRLADTAAFLPRLGFNALRHGLLPTPSAAALVLWREGVADLHWKAVGDAVVRFAQRSGPLTTKLGQILATRTDVLPASVCVRLEALYSRQPAMSRRQLDAALRMAFPDGLPFRTLDRQPLGVGSIAQIHRAELAGGERVIVKLVRPGLRREIERDLNATELLLGLLLGLPTASPSTRLAVSRAFRDLGTALRCEVDLRQEARSLEEFGQRLRRNSRVCVPAVFRQWCSRTALVMEELVGEPLSAVRARAHTDPETAHRIADLALKEILKQVFAEGRFHADPHAGNLLLLGDGRLGLIDLGLTGESGEQDRQRIARAVRAFMSGDPEALSLALLDFGLPSSDFDFEAFKADVVAVVRRREHQAVAQMDGTTRDQRSGSHLEAFVHDLLRVARRHDLYVPPSSTLIIKTIVTIEGVARSLNPDINVVAAALPIVLASATRRWLRWFRR